jgi:nucleoside-diphosphate-sugar epimerase
MNRILLTGGSGTVGREVLKQLCEIPDTYEITVFDIKTPASVSYYRKFKNRISVVYGDISIRGEVSAVCSNKDMVIHLAAIIPPLADKEPLLAERVNVGGTLNLTECIRNQSPGAFFLYSSSISVYGDRCRDPWIKVTDPLIPSDRDEYARTKIIAEEVVKNSGLRFSIFRLTAIMGTDNHKPSALMFHMPLESKLEIATPADTGRAFVRAINKPDLLQGSTYNLSGGEFCRITYGEFINRSFQIFGLGKADFKNRSFAGRNFHCGFYTDGDVLNDILDFRRDSIDDYFDMVQKSISPLQKALTSVFRRIIKNNLQKKSEPLAAVESGNSEEIRHFF